MIPVLKEGRQYVSSPSQAPKGVAVKRGPRGGYYYEEPVKKDKKETTSKLEGKLTKDNFTFDQPIGGFGLYTYITQFDQGLKNLNDPEREYDFEIEWKTPDESLKEQYEIYKMGKDKIVSFLEWVNAVEGTPKLERYTKMLKGEKVSLHKSLGEKPLPIIWKEYKKDGTLTKDQEGRTRSLAAKYAGLKEIPVLKIKQRDMVNEDDYEEPVAPKSSVEKPKDNMEDLIKKEEKLMKKLGYIWDKYDRNIPEQKKKLDSELKVIREKEYEPLMETVMDYREEAPKDVKFSSEESEAVVRQAEAGEGGHIEYISPNEYLEFAGLDSSSFSMYSIKKIYNGVKGGHQFDIGFLNVGKDNKITGHEGRHRAAVARMFGIEKIPVAITGEGHKDFSVDKTKSQSMEELK